MLATTIDSASLRVNAVRGTLMMRRPPHVDLGTQVDDSAAPVHPRINEVSAELTDEPNSVCDQPPDVDLVAALRLENEHLKIALQSARVIAAAVGIVMATDKVVYEDGFKRLAQISQDTNQKLRDLAEYVLLTGTVPHITTRQRPGQPIEVD